MRKDGLTALSFAWLVLLVTLSTRLEAQTVPSPYRFIETRHALGFHGGYISLDEGKLDLAPRSAPLIGARYNLRLTGPLSGEVGLAFSPTERPVYAAPAAGGGETLDRVGDVDMLLTILEAGLRFDLTGQRHWRGITPYAVGTIGAIANLLSSDDDQLPDDQRFKFGPGFAASAGLGSDFFLSERISVRAEIRDYLWRLTYPSGLTSTGLEEEEWQNNFSFSLGGAYHF